MPDGTAVQLFTLKNSKGMIAGVISLGATLVSLTVPDRNGTMEDVILGFDRLDGYLQNKAYLGVIVGRYANRIGGARFSLDGKEYRVGANERTNMLHGGFRGFNSYVWKVTEENNSTVRMTHHSPDGDEGFPGAVDASVRYTLTDTNELRIEYSATTDKPTVINLTNHAYFNLAGQKGGDVLSHEMTIHADAYTPVDSALIPTGELASVQGTPFDFRSPHKIGERIDAPHEQLKLGGGYDHNWVLNQRSGLSLAAVTSEGTSGRVMETWTTEPGVQLYTGNFLDASIVCKGNRPAQRRGAFCLETQHYPDSPNKPTFPSTVLRPGATYTSTTAYRFATLPKK